MFCYSREYGIHEKQTHVRLILAINKRSDLSQLASVSQDAFLILFHLTKNDDRYKSENL